MNTQSRHEAKSAQPKARLAAFLVGMLAAISSAPSAAAIDVAQAPLSVATSVPGNLVLVPSVEFPTLISVANFGNYSVATTYAGYFDSDKCYAYVYDDIEAKRHFAPRSAAAERACVPGLKLWSGNYLNWAATQTIDPFRSALTGGYRVLDTPTETWIEKAIADRDGQGNFPRRTIPSSGDNVLLVSSQTPASWTNFRNRIDGLDNKMRFTSGRNQSNLDVNNPNPNDLFNPRPPIVSYNPAIHDLDFDVFRRRDDSPRELIGINHADVVYEVSLRVKVCDPQVGLENNCVQYAQGFKPEGLLQEYSNRLLYSIFGYINNGGGTEPDGGVMRAKQKFIGPLTRYPAQNVVNNTAKEWDPVTGVLYVNPDQADASATASNIVNSGVINYLNRFGQMRTGRTVKSFDNVSELYYAATRYLKNIGNVPSFSTLSNNLNTRYQEADGFPVITNWDDPVRYQCQANVILGIGDTNTWRDKNLPGDTNTRGEPAKPTLVSGDDSVDVVKALRQIYLMEGLSQADADTRSKAEQFNGRQNSAYIAALAYDSHTRDIRPADKPNALPGKQTIATYWVDVVEGGDYKKNNNQYWLAGKYGGFTVPEGFDPYAPSPSRLNDASWWNGRDYVNGTSEAGNGYKRANNFYTAAEAGKMVESLRKAFENIVAETQGSGTGVAANSSSLEAGAQSFQARFFSGSWRGDVSAYNVDPVTGAVSPQPRWNASDKYSAGPRTVYTSATSDGYGPLIYATLAAAQKSILGSEQVVDYLRGDRALEGTENYRVRRGALGDIINSEPVYVGRPNASLYQGRDFSGAASYQNFARDKANRTPVVYVGSNDGMLHGFNAGTTANAGVETYAFMPKSAINAGLKSYTQVDYTHRYFVDGELTVADVFINGGWKSVLVGTLGRGGRGIFALDVTDPNAVRFLWEKTATDIPALGNNLGKPLIGQVQDGDWRVVLGNGPNSTDGNAQLISISLATGAAKVINAGAGPDNALTAVRLWDADGDQFAESAYAGDIKGNVWRFKALDGTGTVARLFTATGPSGAQPFTAAPLVARNAETGDTWVFIGSGKYISEGDVSDKKVQSWYGLIDKGTTIAGRTQLSKTDILAENSVARAIEEVLAPGPSGWYMDLVSPPDSRRGERMIVSNRFQGKVLIGTTRIPDATNPCLPTGTGYVMAIDPFTGGRLNTSFFDVDGNGTVGNSGDTILINGVPVPASGLLLQSGPNSPVFTGDVAQIGLDNGSLRSVRTRTNSNAIKRVTWREVLGGN